MLKQVSLILLITFLAITGNAVSGESGEITVSAAMSLKNAFEEIEKLYETNHNGEKIILNLSSSGKLAKQIETGAPVDVYASASQKYMNDVEKKGFIISSSRINFASNSVALITPASSKIPIKSFKELMKKEVKKIAIGNPGSVPAGRYAKEVLIFYNLWDNIQDKLVFAENVRQVLDYVARNEADAGIVYSTDATSRAKEVNLIMKAPEKSHAPIVYPIAVVKDTKNEKMAKKFIKFVISAQGKKVLQKYGFEVVP